MEAIHLARLRVIEHNIPFYFLPHSGDNVVISEGEDDRYVVIQGDKEGRHLWEGEHQAGGHVGD